MAARNHGSEEIDGRDLPLEEALMEPLNGAGLFSAGRRGQQRRKGE